jgi:hypothetical protein
MSHPSHSMKKKNLCLPLEKKKTEIRKGVPQCLSLAKRLKKKKKKRLIGALCRRNKVA